MMWFLPLSEQGLGMAFPHPGHLDISEGENLPPLMLVSKLDLILFLLFQQCFLQPNVGLAFQFLHFSFSPLGLISPLHDIIFSSGLFFWWPHFTWIKNILMLGQTGDKQSVIANLSDPQGRLWTLKTASPQGLVSEPYRLLLGDSLSLIAPLHTCSRLRSLLAAPLNPILFRIRMKRHRSFKYSYHQCNKYQCDFLFCSSC